MTAQVSRNKSTNVRSLPTGLKAARAGLRVLAPHAPNLAARVAEHFFLTARRHPRPHWEEVALASAIEGSIAHDGGSVPTWTWTPEVADLLEEAPKTVLLVHGWEGRGSQLAHFVAPLLARGLRVVAFDAPGHGDSSLARASLVEHARAIRSVADVIGPVHALIGHSVGGASALLATRFGLKAGRFALIAPPTDPGQFAATFARALGLGDSLKAAMIARLEARYAIRFDELDVRSDAARLEAPMLVVHDKDDRVVRFEQGQTLANAAPRGEIVETSGLGHVAILRDGTVVDSVTQFVSEGASANFSETIDGELFFRESRW